MIQVYVGSGWAGCRRTRKSTSGGVIDFGDVAVRGWSSNQAVIALSSGEAEYYAALKGASAPFRSQSMLACGARKAPTLRDGIPLVAGSSKGEEASSEESVENGKSSRLVHQVFVRNGQVEALRRTGRCIRRGTYHCSADALIFCSRTVVTLCGPRDDYYYLLGELRRTDFE